MVSTRILVLTTANELYRKKSETVGSKHSEQQRSKTQKVKKNAF